MSEVSGTSLQNDHDPCCRKHRERSAHGGDYGDRVARGGCRCRRRSGRDRGPMSVHGRILCEEIRCRYRLTAFGEGVPSAEGVLVADGCGKGRQFAVGPRLHRRRVAGSSAGFERDGVDVLEIVADKFGDRVSDVLVTRKSLSRLLEFGNSVEVVERLRIECILLDGRDASGDGNRHELSASGERFLLDGLDAVEEADG